MKILFEEYSDIILTIIGGFVILSIILSVCLQTKLDVMHSENLGKLNPIYEKIGEFECNDILIDELSGDIINNDNLIKDGVLLNNDYLISHSYLTNNVIANSNYGKDIKDHLFARIKQDNDHYYIEYILKYNNDFMIKKVKCYIKEGDNDENDV